MTMFLALYRGKTVDDAQMVAVTADPTIVTLVAKQLLYTPQSNDDPIITAIDRGRKHALRLITRETRDARA
jgi:hypothetical protein